MQQKTKQNRISEYTKKKKKKAEIAATYCRELRRWRSVKRVIGRRVLVQQSRQVHDPSAMESFVPIKGTNLGSDPTNHEMLKDWSHCQMGNQQFSPSDERENRIGFRWAIQDLGLSSMAHPNHDLGISDLIQVLEL